MGPGGEGPSRSTPVSPAMSAVIKHQGGDVVTCVSGEAADGTNGVTSTEITNVFLCDQSEPSEGL